MFRLSAMMVLLAAFVATFATAQVTFCRVNRSGALPVLTTLDTSASSYDEDSDLLGHCQEYLGQICDDADFCTIDYDYELVVCLPYPRTEVDDCAMES